MSTSELRFYLDENMNPEIAIQLERHGIDAVSARDAGMLHAADSEQLRFAADGGRVLCTADTDFADPTKFKLAHQGIAYLPRSNRSIGYIVAVLREFYQNETLESMQGRLVYL